MKKAAIVAMMLLVAACTGEEQTGNNFVPIDRPAPAPETTVTVDGSLQDFDGDCFSNAVEQMLGHDYEDVEDHPVDEDGNCVPDQFEGEQAACTIQERDGQLEAVCTEFSVPL